MINTDKYEGLTIDDWYNLEAHQWEEVMHSYCDMVRVNKSLHFQLDGKHEDGLKWIEKCEELDAEVKRLREVIKKIKECATINAQHDDILEKQEWEYILEMIE
tara:strand:- start:229 stop:537 length:309 start_codon:yes stop_codon:yes gene_type:complete